MATARPLTSDWHDQYHLSDFYPQLELGDCLEFKRSLGYSHWAIYSGASHLPHGKIEHRIIHRSIPPNVGLETLANPQKIVDLFCCQNMGVIEEAHLTPALLATDKVRVNNSMDRQWKALPGNEVVTRALMKMSESPQVPYNLLTNNCEHFVNDCRYKRSFSQQVIDGCKTALSKIYEFAVPDEERISIAKDAGELIKSIIPSVFAKKSED